MWYDCQNSCSSTNGCLVNGCCQKSVLYSSTSLNVSQQNQLSIINSVKCNALNYLRVSCPQNISVIAGDKINLTLETHDLDSPTLTISYAGNYPAKGITKNCTTISSGQICDFSYQSTPKDIGKEYWINLIVSDGYGQVIKNFNLKNLNNQPQLLYPKSGDTLTAPNLAYNWTAIASLQPVIYQIRIYQMNTTNLVYSKAFYDPAPNSINKHYTITNVPLTNQDYFTEILATNNYGYKFYTTLIKFTLTGSKVVNQAPKITTPVLSSNSTQSISSISATTVYTDANKDMGYVNFIWEVNGVIVREHNGIMARNGNTVKSTLSNQYFKSGDGVKVTVFAEDGVAFSSQLSATTTTYTKNNYPPSLTTPAISSTNGVSATTTYTDQNKDVGWVTFQWLVNDVEVFTEPSIMAESGNNVKSTLPSNYYKTGDNIKVTVIAEDGATFCSPITSSTVKI